MWNCIYGVSAGGEGVTEGAQRAANAMIDAWLEGEGDGGGVCAPPRAEGEDGPAWTVSHRQMPMHSVRT